MTKLLEKAFTEAAKLPDAQQNALAEWLMCELEDEQRWEEQFRNSGSALDKLAAEAVEEHRAGRTKPLEPGKL